MPPGLSGLIGSVVGRGRGEEEEESQSPPREYCLVCGSSLADSELYARFRVCDVCGFHYSMNARERIVSLVDPGSFREINRSITSLDPLSFSSKVSYKQRIFRDQRRTGLTEAAVTGVCAISGSPAMLIVLDFGFMGGTMGCVVGEKVALALERAARNLMPVIAVVTSGGARIQEGALSLMQMAKTTFAAGRLHSRGLPFISVLANPATGQAYASFASLADIVLAEPGAIVGVSSLRQIQQSTDEPLPEGAHTAESFEHHGALDAVVERSRLRDMLSATLDLLGPQYWLTPREKRGRRRSDEPTPPAPQAWDSVQLARHEERPSALGYVDRIFSPFVELHGDRHTADDPAIACGIGRLGGQTVVIVGQERGRSDVYGARSRNDGRTSPAGFRKAQRALRMAAKFKVPLITLIDTPGPYLGLEAEQSGLGGAIAETMALLSQLDAPSISVVIGEGGNAGALALGVADRVLMMENAIYSVTSPEDAAELMYQDEAMAEEAAESLKLTASDCLSLGIVDSIVHEPPGGAHLNPDDAARQLRRVLLMELAELQTVSSKRLLRDRYRKFRNMGEYSSHFRTAITREVDALQGLVATGVRRMARRQPPEPPGDVSQDDIAALFSAGARASNED